MKWFFGFYRLGCADFFTGDCAIPDAVLPFLVFTNRRFTLYGDHPESSPTDAPIPKGEQGTIVCGYGLCLMEDSVKFIPNHELPTHIFHTNTSRPEGQYAWVAWNAEQVTIGCDAIGLRKIYSYTDEEKRLFYFSTRLDIITSIIKDRRIQFEALGSFYKYVNPLRLFDTFVKGVQSSGPGTTITLSPLSSNHASTHNQQWQVWPSHRFAIDNLLERIALAPLCAGYATILSLSAGVDSRTLLAIYLKNRHSDFSAYSAGSAELADLVVAQGICRDESIPLLPFFFNPYQIEDLYGFLREVALRTNLFFDLSNALYFWGIKNSPINHGKSVIVDGYFGEIMRCSYGNKLVFHGKEKILKHDPTVFDDWYNKPIPAIFSGDVRELLNKGGRKDAQQVFIDMPPPERNALEQWTDLFTIRYRLCTQDSGYMDSIMPNIMPFTLDCALNTILCLNKKEKANNKINRGIISSRYPSLKKYPLVSKDLIVPFMSCRNNRLLTAYRILMKKIHTPYHETIHQKILLTLKQTILDTISSQEVRECGYYDKEKLPHYAASFYAHADPYSAHELMEFLAIDYWRQFLISTQLKI
ncbi:MAG: hypothetical protein JW795_16930 [Chitinivibrionales bacterium]|nr:hypothetical protein [Chitinivibrionales bacterium]